MTQEQQSGRGAGRREFIKRVSLLAAAGPVAALGSWALRSDATATPAQDWHGAVDTPAAATWRTVITQPHEPGEPLLMTGRIFQAGGVTPARGVLLYVYHTDATGYYNNPNKLPARLRGWMRTGADGRYEFRTIKPAPYPGHDVPAHIHATLTAAAYPEDWIDSFWFAGDPFITPAQRATLTGRGGFNPIVALTRGADGVLRGQRDIQLGRV